MKLDEFMYEVGMNKEETLRRFMNMDHMLIKFLKKFPDDSNYEMLENGVKNKDLDNVEIAAHTLKGISANLGLDRLKELAQVMVNGVRSDKTENLEEEFAAFSEEYRKTCSLIQNLDT